MKTKEIAEFLSADLVGDPDVKISGVASLESAGDGHISFLSKTAELSSAASAGIVPIDFDQKAACTLIKVANPRLAFALLANKLIQRDQRYFEDGRPTFISKSAIVKTVEIGAFVTIGEDSYVGECSEIGNGVSIGRNVEIGEFSVIQPNCTIYDNVEIGRNCVIHAGTVIGSPGFGYVKTEEGEHLQFPQIGTVVIEDNVEIGANCTIDRGSLGETRISEGTKIDNLVHIAHNVQIGKRVLIAGQSGIAGSSKIEDDVIIAGQVGISDHVTIKAGAIIGAKSSVFPNKIIRPGFWVGNPVRRHADYVKETTMIRGLERLNEEVEKLKK